MQDRHAPVDPIMQPSEEGRCCKSGCRDSKVMAKMSVRPSTDAVESDRP